MHTVVWLATKTTLKTRRFSRHRESQFLLHPCPRFQLRYNLRPATHNKRSVHYGLRWFHALFCLNGLVLLENMQELHSPCSIWWLQCSSPFSVRSTFWIMWWTWQTRKFKYLFWGTSFATSELYAGSLVVPTLLIVCVEHRLSETYCGTWDTLCSAQIPSSVLRNHNFPVSHPMAAVEPSGLRHMQRGRSSSSFLRMGSLSLLPAGKQ